MGYALAKDQQRFITRLVKAGKFNNQSEPVREAIRRRQRQETDYLAPPPLTPAQVEAVYGREDKQADTVGRAAFKAISKLDVQRFGHHFEGLEVKVNADGGFSAEEAFGYSP